MGDDKGVQSCLFVAFFLSPYNGQTIATATRSRRTSCQFPAQTNALQRVRHFFFFFSPSETSVQALLWFKGLFFFYFFFSIFFFLNVVAFFFIFSFSFSFFTLFYYVFHESDCLCSCWQSLPLFSFHFLEEFYVCKIYFHV